MQQLSAHVTYFVDESELVPGWRLKKKKNKKEKLGIRAAKEGESVKEESGLTGLCSLCETIPCKLLPVSEVATRVICNCYKEIKNIKKFKKMIA